MNKQILLPILLFAATHLGYAATSVKALLEPFERSTNLLIEIASKSGCPVPPLPPGCKLHISGRVIRVLNDAGRQGGLLGHFEADVTQTSRSGLSQTGWSLIHLEVGRQFVVCSHPSPSLTAMIEEPTWAGPVPVGEDFVGDLELMIGGAHRPVEDQISAVTLALIGATTPRSGELARYAVSLLAEAPRGDTVALSQAIESGGSALSASGKNTLLFSLWSEVRGQQVPAENLLRLLVRVVARYFVEAPANPGREEPDLRQQIVRNQLPWILGSEQAKAMLRTEVLPAVAEQFRQAALTEKDSMAARFSPADRETMKQLAEFIGQSRR